MIADWVAWSAFGSGLFVAGWWSGRRNLKRRLSERSRVFGEQYRQGLGYLIQNKTDRALDIFLDQLEVSSDSLELYLALGGLYRRNGEVDRAIRLHQGLLDESVLAKGLLTRAQWQNIHLALAEDYLAAGLLDRAEQVLSDLLQDERDLSAELQERALRHLQNLYEQEKEWQHAISVAESLLKLGVAGIPSVLAHYRCELAELAKADGRTDDAERHYLSALRLDGESIRACYGLGVLAFDGQNFRRALKFLQRLETSNLAYFSDVLSMMKASYQALDREEAYGQYLEGLAADLPQRMDLSQPANSEKSELAWQQRIEAIFAKKAHYKCQHCGFEGQSVYWNCPSCQQWGSLKSHLV